MNMHATIELPFLCNGEVNTHLQQHRNSWETVFSVGPASRLYNEDLRQLRGELRESLETAVEDMVCYIVVCEV
jgi:hypothetical protein